MNLFLADTNSFILKKIDSVFMKEKKEGIFIHHEKTNLLKQNNNYI